MGEVRTDGLFELQEKLSKNRIGKSESGTGRPTNHGNSRTHFPNSAAAPFHVVSWHSKMRHHYGQDSWKTVQFHGTASPIGLLAADPGCAAGWVCNLSRAR